MPGKAVGFKVKAFSDCVMYKHDGMEVRVLFERGRESSVKYRISLSISQSHG